MLMLSYFVLFSLITVIFSFEPCCTTCKYFIPHKNTEKSLSLGKCNLFKDVANYNDKRILFNNFAVHCRNDENLCGKDGVLYEEKNDDIEKDIINDYKELNNRCCGEVNEKDEIEQLEKDFFEIFQRIKKYNKKRIYKN